MNKKIALALVWGAFLVPVISSAGFRYSFGGRIDPVSGGLEFRMFFPTKAGNAVFIAPHAIGIFTSYSDDQEIYYSAGLRTGIMFSQENWLSPYIGIGAGSSGEIYNAEKLMGLGGRLFAGASIAPFYFINKNSEQAKNLRLDFESGFMYKHRIETISHGTFEDSEDYFWFPDIGFGINYNW